MKIQFSSGLQTSANMHTHTHTQRHIHRHTPRKHTQHYNMQLPVCVDDPIKKKKTIVATHIVRQAGRQSNGVGSEGHGTFVAQTFVDLCNKTVAQLHRDLLDNFPTGSKSQRGPPAEMFAFVLLHY